MKKLWLFCETGPCYYALAFYYVNINVTLNLAKNMYIKQRHWTHNTGIFEPSILFINYRLFILLLLSLLSCPASSNEGQKTASSICSESNTISKDCPQQFKTTSIAHRLRQIWYEGNNELYLSGYAWHNRHTYSHRKIKSYNEYALGGGWGKGFYDEKGNWRGLTAVAFLDSHKNIEPAVGYLYLKTAMLSESFRIGGGYAALVTARPDIFKGNPFPGLLPWVSLTYRKATLSATYIPGAQGAGNVLYIIGKWTFDK